MLLPKYERNSYVKVIMNIPSTLNNIKSNDSYHLLSAPPPAVSQFPILGVQTLRHRAYSNSNSYI